MTWSPSLPRPRAKVYTWISTGLAESEIRRLAYGQFRSLDLQI